VESPLVNAQNFYTAITRAMYGVRLWTNNVKELVDKLERQSGEKTSSTEGLGRMDQDRVGPFTNRQGARLATLKAEQQKDRTSRRDRTLERQLSRRDRGPRGTTEHIAEGEASPRSSTGFSRAFSIALAPGSSPRQRILNGSRQPPHLNPNPFTVPNDRGSSHAPYSARYRVDAPGPCPAPLSRALAASMASQAGKGHGAAAARP
jgi:hypothetical protein